MKLRIQGNSLRLRLTQKEVGLVRNRGVVESLIEFAPGHSITYLLEGSLGAQTISATFDGRAIRVTIPMHQMTDWVEGDQVGIEARLNTGVQLLVEKDFKCLHRSVEQEPDDLTFGEPYPHPLMT